MSTMPSALWPRLNRVVRRLAGSLTEAPPCAICGRGHAQTGWHMDPLGGMHGRCPGCLGHEYVGATKPATPRPNTQQAP